MNINSVKCSYSLKIDVSTIFISEPVKCFLFRSELCIIAFVLGDLSEAIVNSSDTHNVYGIYIIHTRG